MPKDLLIKTLLEAEQNKEYEIGSYSQLVSALAGNDLADIEVLLEELKQMSFIEDEDVLYSKLPMAVFYKQLPVISEADVLVKVVLMQQGDGLILIVPENVVQAYEDLVENPDLVTEKNNNVSLYAEIYNFDSTDEKLHDLIKETYINAGNGIKPFDLTDELLQDKEDSQDSEEEPEGTDMIGDDDFDFDEIVDELPEMEDFEANESAYKKFKKQSNYLENLIKKLNKKANENIKKNVRTKFIHKVLVIEVDNKNIYRQYENIPAVAKKLLTNFGEAIRVNTGTQLVDSFSKDGKRYFVVAENLANNYWYVVKEDMDQLNENEEAYISPKAPIKLRKSSIRKESRAVIPYKLGKKIIFVSKTLK